VRRVTSKDNVGVSVRQQEVHMELVFENGWNSNRWLDNLNSFRRDIEQTTGGDTWPRADVVEDKDAYHLYFEMPGLKGEALDVQVENDQVTVAAEQKRPEWPQGIEVHVAERTYGPIRRSFRLPLDANRNDIRAAYTDGVLEVTVEKRPEAKPVKIQVS
jgi:HSP20 family protein